MFTLLYFIGYNVGVYCVDQDSERANIEDAHALQVLTLYGSEVDNNNLHSSFFKLIIHIILMLGGGGNTFGFHAQYINNPICVDVAPPHETVK